MSQNAKTAHSLYLVLAGDICRDRQCEKPLSFGERALGNSIERATQII